MTPLNFNTGFLAAGGTSIILEKFDEEKALESIEKYKVTHSQWVPTMFVRFLKVDPSIRTQYDLSSHQVAIHAWQLLVLSQLKEQMIDWWGPYFMNIMLGLNTTA